MKILCDCGAALVDVERGLVFDASQAASALHTCSCGSQWFVSISASGVGISPAVGTDQASLVTQGTPDCLFTIVKRREPNTCRFVNDDSGQFSFSTVLSGTNWGKEPASRVYIYRTNEGDGHQVGEGR